MRHYSEDAILERSTLRGLKLGSSQLTLGATLTLTDQYPTVLELDAGGATRTVTLPTRALANDDVVRLIFNQSTDGENLTIKDGSTTLLTLPPTAVAICLALHTQEALSTRTWAALQLGGESLALTDDLSVAGDATITGNLTTTGTLTQTGAGTYTGTQTFNGNVVLGDAGTDLATINGQIDLDSATATLSSNAATITKWGAVITTESLTTAHTATQALVITKTGVAAGDLAFISMVGGTNTQGVPVFNAVCTSNTVTITLRNNAIATNAFNGTFIFNLWVVKA